MKADRRWMRVLGTCALALLLGSCTHGNETVPPIYRPITDVVAAILTVVAFFKGFGLPNDWGPR